MDEQTKALCEAQAEIFKAMAHPTRLYMVHQLAKGERCVCELQAGIDADMSTVSKHLAILKNAGIVKDQKRGLQVYYRLCCPCILRFMDCIDTVIQENARCPVALTKD